MKCLKNLFVLAMGIVLGSQLVGCGQGSAEVYVDNASKHDVSITVNGKKWISVPKAANLKEKLQPGKYVLVVSDQKTGDQLDQLHVTIDQTQRPYVLNVLGDEVYYQGLAIYGYPPDFKMEMFKKKNRVIRDKWFLVDEVEYLFKEPPLKLSMPSRTQYKTVSYLLRGKPLDDPIP